MTKVDIIKDLIKETVDTLNKYECKEFGNGEKLVIVIGEEHENFDQHHFQEKIIKHFRPNYVLLELLHGVNYDYRENKVSFRDKNCINEIDNESDKLDIEDFKRASYQNLIKPTFFFYKHISNLYKVPLIGCDLSIEERKYFLPGRPLEKGRENKMNEIINTYLGKSSKLITILGNNHAEHICEIYERKESTTELSATYLFILLNLI
jgi:hypothetical protein